MKIVLAIILASMVSIVLTGCSDAPKTISVLSSQGYTDIDVLGFTWRSAVACSEDDQFRTSFTATSPAGKLVSGTVCSGWLKGATIRFD
jgi:hypothetical protein